MLQKRFTFHPVALNVFPPLPIVMVLSHIFGKLAAKQITYSEKLLYQYLYYIVAVEDQYFISV